MPEGDTIFRTAVRLRQVLVGKRVIAASSRAIEFDVETLVGDEISAVEARGKHLLVHFGRGRTLHTHMGMHGSWHTYLPGEAWQKPQRQAAMVIEVEQAVVVCFGPKILELLTRAELGRDPYLNRLGPDLLSHDFDEDEVLRRLRVHDRTAIGEAVMNQTIVCGIGNVYKSELLFLVEVHPSTPVGKLSDHQLGALLFKARDLMTRNLVGFQRQTRFAGGGQKKWVYGRSGQPCFKCGEQIQITRQGDLGRTTYFCPTCQRPPEEPGRRA